MKARPVSSRAPLRMWSLLGRAASWLAPKSKLDPPSANACHTGLCGCHQGRPTFRTAANYPTGTGVNEQASLSPTKCQQNAMVSRPAWPPRRCPVRGQPGAAGLPVAMGCWSAAYGSGNGRRLGAFWRRSRSQEAGSRTGRTIANCGRRAITMAIFSDPENPG